MQLADEQLVTMYRQMLTIRSFDDRVRDLWKADLITGSTHSYAGQEAVAVGACAALKPSDYVTSTHRGHGHLIAKGGDTRLMMAELMGKYDGYCHGKGGSMHIADLDIGVLGACGIVGGGVPMAVGAALSAQLRDTEQVTACFFGEGAVNQGCWHEALNLASVWKVPAVFICENNLYAITTRVSRATNIDNLADRAVAYGIPGIVVDGMDAFAVYEAAAEAVGRARAGLGPSLLECKCYRFEGHWVGDDASYRTQGELRSWRERDPIPAFRQRLLDMGILSAQEATAIQKQIADEIEAAIEFAKAAPHPTAECLWEGLYV